MGQYGRHLFIIQICLARYNTENKDSSCFKELISKVLGVIRAYWLAYVCNTGIIHFQGIKAVNNSFGI